MIFKKNKPKKHARAASNTIVPSNSQLDQLKLCNIDKLHQLGLNGTGIRVAVFDSFFSIEHSTVSHLKVIDTKNFYNESISPIIPTSFCILTILGIVSEHGTQVLSALAGKYNNDYIGSSPEVEVLLGATDIVFSL